MTKKVYPALMGLIVCLFWTWVMTLFNFDLVIATIFGFVVGLFMIWMTTYGEDRKE